MTQIPIQLVSVERGQDLRGQPITEALGANQTIELQIEVVPLDQLEAGAFLEPSHLTCTGRALRRGRAVGPQRFQVALDCTLTGTAQQVSAKVFERHRVELGHAFTNHGPLALQLVFAGTAPSAERDAKAANVP